MVWFKKADIGKMIPENKVTGADSLKNIQEDIKTKNFKTAYLLYGEEAYLKQQYKHNLIRALNTDGDDMNFSHYEGKEH